MSEPLEVEEEEVAPVEEAPPSTKRSGAKGALDTAASVGLGLLSMNPFLKQGLSHGLSAIAGVPVSAINEQFDQLADEHPYANVGGKALGLIPGAALTFRVGASATALGGAAFGALQGASEVAENLETTPLDVEKALCSIGLSSIIGAAIPKSGAVISKIPAGLRALVGPAEKVAGNLGVKAISLLGGFKGFAAVQGTPKALSAMAKGFDKALENQVTKFFKHEIVYAARTAGASAAGLISAGDSHEGEDIDELVQNPEVAVGIAEYLKDLPPKVSDGIQARVQVAAMEYQNAKQKNGSPLTPQLYDRPPTPNDTSRARIAQIRAVLDNPLAVMDNPNKDAIEAVQAVYPEISQAIGRSVLAKLADKPDISYGTKMQASKLIGMPLDSTQLPDFGFSMQQRLQAQRLKKQNAGQQTSARTHAAVRKANRASLTRAQRLSADDED